MPSPKPRIRIRFGCLTALIAGAGLFLLCLNGYRAVISSMPDRAGKIRLSGLASEVRVTRDGFSVPAIDASSRRDLFLALGYVTAQDRLFQMELSRRTAAGRLSEWLGPEAAALDSLMRKIGLADAARHAARSLSPESAEILDAYAAGVNASAGPGGSRVPVEFRFMDASFEPWTAADCISVLRLFAWQADSRWLVEPVRQALSPGMKPDRGGKIPAELRDRLLAILDAAVRKPEPAGLTPDPFTGTFGLAVSGPRSYSGRPLLIFVANSAVQIPSPWYQAVLRCPDFEASGFTVPGYPLVLAGHNGSTAWAFSASGEKRSPWRPVSWDESANPVLKRDTLTVLNAADIPIETGRTPSGPLVCRIPAKPGTAGGMTGMVLEWAGLEPDDETAVLLNMNRSATAAEFLAKSARLRLPGFSWIAADTQGGAGISGAVRPASNRQEGTVWITAGDFRCDGILDRAIPADSRSLPRFSRLSAVWPDSQPVSISDCRRLLADAVSVRSSHLVRLALPALTGLQRSDSAEAAGLRLLSAWDGGTRTGSPAAALAETFLDRLCSNLIQDGSAPSAAGLAVRIPSLRLDMLQDSLTKPGAAKTHAEAVRKSFADAVSAMKEKQGADPEAWNWGSVHELRFDHPLGGRWPFRGFFRTDPFPMGGSQTTVESWPHRPGGPQFHIVSGPSARFIIDLSDFDRSVSCLSTGQSGQVMDLHYRDQMNLFTAGGFRQDLWDRDKIERSGGSVLRMEP
ncbi:MAG: penicillin acylase family protein [bacterium]|nr:penicillin acylase family protein [bacterium]